MGYFITSFVICFYSLGAFVTRYISYEGMMPIREGAAENQFIQTKHSLPFLSMGYKGEMKRRVLKTTLAFTSYQ
jgi:hypothetical protein